MLQIDDLQLSISGSRILNGVSFRLNPGERLGLIGPNGSGKTTLFNCISGFHQPTSGRILLRNQDITRTSPSGRANLGIGRVFQNFGIFRQMSLLENLLTALETKQRSSIFPWGEATKHNKAQALEYLRLVGLEAKAAERASSLSGGQMRLLEITRTIAFGADLFLLDEPTAGVSPRMKGEIEQALAKLQELGKTILIIEHDINFIQRLCDRVLVLDVGRVVLDNSPEAVRADPMLQDIYFGASA